MTKKAVTNTPLSILGYFSSFFCSFFQVKVIFSSAPVAALLNSRRK
ncbi:MAG: hypothetical protein U5L45_16740 [Saprospiraceae bacterium]|nr:hypothetical protein [Saprospiraceae bacterium]